VCSGCAEGVLRVCSGCAEGVLRVCSGCAWGVLGVCSGCAQGVLRVCYNYLLSLDSEMQSNNCLLPMSCLQEMYTETKRTHAYRKLRLNISTKLDYPCNSTIMSTYSYCQQHTTPHNIHFRNYKIDILATDRICILHQDIYAKRCSDVHGPAY
jgi:hypothetical protein